MSKMDDSRSAKEANLAQGQGIGSNLGHQQLLLHRGGKVDAALQHAAAMAMGGNLHGVRTGSIVHKLAVLWAQALQAPLDDMVAIQVPDEGDHPLLETVNHQLPLHSATSRVKGLFARVKSLFWQTQEQIHAD